MIDRLEATLEKYNSLTEELSKPEVLSDVKKMTSLSKEQASLADIIEKYKYDFGIVNDEDVSVPDFSGYKVEYQNWNMSDIGE
mgnify:CR=1 FL=1